MPTQPNYYRAAWVGLIYAGVIGMSLSLSAVAQQGGAPPAPVEVGNVELRPVVLSTRLVASVEPILRSVVAAEQDGLVSQRHFEEGQPVTKGQLLIKKDTQLLESQIRIAELAIVTAQAQVDQQKAQLENAEAETARVSPLRQQGVVTEKEWRDVQTVERVFKARLAQSESELSERSAELQRLKLQLSKSQVFAPFDGVIATRRVEVGQWLSAGDAVAEVVSVDPVHVRVMVPESVISRVNPGDTAKIEIDAMGGQTLPGTVDQILPEGDASSRTFAVKIKVDNPQGLLKPGYFARVTLESSSQQKRVMVPRAAVVTSGGGAGTSQSKIVLHKDGKAVIIPVRVTGSEANMLVIEPAQTSPTPQPWLTDGDTVVTRGNEMLTGGETLMVVNLAGQDAQPSHPPSSPPSSQTQSGIPNK